MSEEPKVFGTICRCESCMRKRSAPQVTSVPEVIVSVMPSHHAMAEARQRYQMPIDWNDVMERIRKELADGWVIRLETPTTMMGKHRDSFDDRVRP